jgi:hypothetical protein
MWVSHWAVSGIAFWGFIFLVIHAVLVGQLVHGQKDPLLLLMGVFCNQTIVSTVVLAQFKPEYWRPILGGAISFTVVALLALVRVIVLRRRA